MLVFMYLLPKDTYIFIAFCCNVVIIFDVLQILASLILPLHFKTS